VDKVEFLPAILTGKRSICTVEDTNYPFRGIQDRLDLFHHFSNHRFSYSFISPKDLTFLPSFVTVSESLKSTSSSTISVDDVTRNSWEEISEPV